MGAEATYFAAIAETTSFLRYFKELPDPRQAGKVDYPLVEVLLLSLLAVLAGAETFCDIARFGEKKLELLRRVCQVSEIAGLWVYAATATGRGPI